MAIDRFNDINKQGFMKLGRGKKPVKYEVIDPDEGLIYHGENKYEAERIARSKKLKVTKYKNPYLGFKKLTKQLEAKGADTPKALAAWIGRKKYGAKKFASMARKSNPKKKQFRLVYKMYRRDGSSYTTTETIEGTSLEQVTKKWEKEHLGDLNPKYLLDIKENNPGIGEVKLGYKITKGY